MANHPANHRLSNHKPAAPAQTTRLPERKDATAPALPDPETLLAQVGRLPGVPAIAMDVMRLVNDSEASLREIARVISHDPQFSARVLQFANSAYYGLPRNVGTISDAVVLLGIRTVRHIAITEASRALMSRGLKGYSLESGDLWRHSLACALAAQMLAEFLPALDEEAAFVAGLLHDIGKVVLSSYVEARLPEITAYRTRENASFVEAERAVLGCDHAELGGLLAQKWHLPLTLTHAIAWHHQPVQKSGVAPLTAVTHIANAVCHAAAQGLGIEEIRASVNSTATLALHLTDSQLEQSIAGLLGRIAEARPGFDPGALLVSPASRTFSGK